MADFTSPATGAAVAAEDILPANQAVGNNINNVIRLNQFSFAASEQTLICILNDLVAARINIEGFWVNKSCTNAATCTNVRLIAGQTAAQLRAIGRILQNYAIRFNQRLVLGVSPNQYARIQGILSCRVTIRAVYNLNTGRCIYDVSDINRAEVILRNASRIRACPRTCFGQPRFQAQNICG